MTISLINPNEKTKMKKALFFSFLLFFLVNSYAQVVVFDFNEYNTGVIDDAFNPNLATDGSCNFYEISTVSFLDETITAEFVYCPPPIDPFDNTIYTPAYTLIQIQSANTEAAFSTSSFSPSPDCIGFPLSTYEQGDLIYDFDISTSSSFYYPIIGVADYAEQLPPQILCTYYYSGYAGFQIELNGNTHYGWIEIEVLYPGGGNFAFQCNAMAIESSPNAPILAGDTTGLMGPFGLSQSYSINPNGIYLNWQTLPNDAACQVRGGPIGGNDPHNFIVTNTPINELFINGNSLTAGQEYQWKVRCATGINPYSGISDWSQYDYFTYDP
ncbi:MAG: hypothetical protein AAF487_11490 [Bacteroidota bacterium]